MIDPLLLGDLFTETYTLLRRHTAGLTHAESLRQPLFRANCANWIVGHIVATRANIMVGLLNVPSIWDMRALMRYIPESAQHSDDGGAWPFEQMLEELARTHERLSAVLNTLTVDALQAVKDEQTLAAHLISYHAHEAYHAGQLDMLCQFVRIDR